VLDLYRFFFNKINDLATSGKLVLNQWCIKYWFMECKFIKHGIALSYDQVLKPCCEWQISDQWRSTHHLKQVDIANWHQHPDVVQTKTQLESGQWPNSCASCERVELQGRHDSIRGNGNHAYANYANDDITLEIRPGNTCNFACQTCWPEASSRVAQYYDQAGIVDIKTVNSNRLDNFEFLIPIAHRIRDVVVLGGEPFYDKSCRKFLTWAQNHLTANLLIFTNGSDVDFDFIKSYPGTITLVFSLDAVGKPAEYIRYDTVWSEVYANYLRAKEFSNVEIRVNITCSIYNYVYIKDLIDLLCEDWPSVVSFGTVGQAFLRESAVPLNFRSSIVASLNQAIDRINATEIESGQKSNAINALTATIDNLKNHAWDQEKHRQFCDVTNRLDTVKDLNINNYCEFVGQFLK